MKEARQHLFLRIGRENPRFFVEGRARERKKEERKTEAYERYLIMLKDRKKILAEEKSPEEKQPRRLLPTYPVSNPESPVVQSRE